MEKTTCIVLVGGPCSGKSSAGKLAAKHLGAYYISSGDIARRMAEANTDAQNNLNNGKLAPEDEMRKAIRHEIRKGIRVSMGNIIILDGFPRFNEQAEWLIDNFRDVLDIHYVLIHAPSWVLRDRAKNRSRADDGSFDKRYSYYRTVTYKQLYCRADTIIHTDNMDVEGCATVLEDYVKEVIDSAKDS